jgi:hypothetical protein
MFKKILVAAILLSGLIAGQAFAKEDHEKEIKHRVKHHEVKKVNLPVPTTNSAQAVTNPISNPITGFSVTIGIPGGYNTSVKLVSVMWAKGVAYSYNVYIDNVKVKTVLDSQGLTFMEYQQVMSVGTHTIGISVLDQSGNESQQCLKTVNVQ